MQAKLRDQDRPGKPTTGLTALVLVGIGTPPIAVWIGGRHWFLDLFNHFQAQYAVALIALGVLLLLLRRWRLAALAAVSLIVPVVRLAPLWIPPAPDGDPALRVATFNVLGSNDRHADTIDWIRRERPDFLYLCETTAEWTKALESLGDLYPHSIDNPREGSFGFLFLSRMPVRESTVDHHGRMNIPLVEVVVETPSGPVRVLGAHPVPPVSRFRAEEHATYLHALTLAAAESDLPTLVLGDLNATRWGHRLRPVLAAGYRDSARGHGYGATWMRGNPLLAIPIDHVLSRGLGPCVRRRIGPDLGSDHRPVVAEFDFAPSR